MSVLVVGSVAIDTVETPYGSAQAILGGSAVYFSLAASLFAPVRLVGVVGEDFPAEFRQVFRGRPICTAGLVVAPGKTFRWQGRYEGQMNQAETRRVQLNVFENFRPEVPAAYRDTPFVFLANGSPGTQLYVRRQVPGARFVMADTMDLWIETQREELLALMRNVDGLILNDNEARLLSSKDNVLKAARWVCSQGPRCCVIKKAEHGAVLAMDGAVFVLPAYPTEEVVEPTGAGDSFAGGLMGYAASCGDHLTPSALQTAMAWGTVTASFTIEGFGTSRLAAATRADLDARLKAYLRMTHLPAR